MSFRELRRRPQGRPQGDPGLARPDLGPLGADRRPGHGHPSPLVEDIKQLRRFAGNIDANKAELDRALQVLPIKLEKVGRTAIYGSWFNFYLCDFKGRVKLPAGVTVPVDYDVGGPRGVTSDEQALPRAQPRDHRGHQPRRDRRPAARRLPGPGPAADRRRRHLLRRLRRGRRPQGRRRGPHRRRTRRQGRRRRARRRPRARSPSRSRPTPSSAARPGAAIRVKTLLGDDVPRPSSRPAPASSTRAPRSPSSAPARRTTWCEAFSGLAETASEHRHRPAGRVADHAGRPHPQHPRGVPVGAARASRPCRPTSRPTNEQINTLLQNLQRVSTVLDDRDQDIVELMRTPTSSSARWSSVATPSTDLLVVHLDAVREAHRAGPREPGRPQARRWPTSTASCTC